MYLLGSCCSFWGIQSSVATSNGRTPSKVAIAGDLHMYVLTFSQHKLGGARSRSYSLDHYRIQCGSVCIQGTVYISTQIVDLGTTRYTHNNNNVIV